jgi:hypothetical protein
MANNGHNTMMQMSPRALLNVLRIQVKVSAESVEIARNAPAALSVGSFP